MALRIGIVGGGPAGTACALTLEAAKRQGLLDALAVVTVIDSGHSDLQAASLWEVPGLPAGSSGPAILEQMHVQLQNTTAQFQKDTVLHIERTEQSFTLACESGEQSDFDILVLAGGYKHFEFQGNLDLKVQKHPYSPKNRTCFVTDAEHRVAPGIYAAGNCSGQYSMFAVAIGSGTAVACQLLSDLAHEPILVHDTLQKH